MYSAKTINEIVNYINNNMGTGTTEYQEIFEKLTLNEEVKNRDFGGDYWNELMLILLENKNKAVESFNDGYFKYLFIAIIKNQFWSSTSQMHKKYRKEKISDSNLNLIQYEDEIDLKIEQENNYNKIEDYLEKNCNWYEKQLFKVKFYEGKSYRQIEREIGITRNSSFNTLSTIFKDLKTKLK